MRIRKNAKVSPLLFTSHAPALEDLQAHVCQLNQSPWDVIPFGSDSYQEVEESFYGSFGDSIGAAESYNNTKRSVASMRNIGSQEKPAEMVEEMKEEPVDKGSNSKDLKDAGQEGEEEEASRSSMLCQRNDGRGWHCKKRAKPGQSYCNHHLSLLRFHQNSIISNNSKGKGTKGNIASKNRGPAAALGTRQTRTKAKKKGPSSDPNDFYYYSGYGPRCWGRRRCEKEEAKALEESRAAAVAAAAANATITSASASPTHQTTSQSSPSRICNEKFDYVDDDDDEDDDEDRSRDSGRKRMRKPIKARSLKSLM